MAGVSIDISNGFPFIGGIGGVVGFPISISIINISMDKYSMIEEDSRTYKIVHKTQTQRFIVAPENKVEM